MSYSKKAMQTSFGRDTRPNVRDAVIFFASIVVFFVANVAPSIAGTYYVDANQGSDNHPGTRQQPWKTMNQVRLASSPGDTIHILAWTDSLSEMEWPVDRSYFAETVYQYGITWTFDRPYRIGQFANWDIWVLGPATVQSIYPGQTLISQDGKDFHVHGSMINPEPHRLEGTTHAYDSRSATYVSDLAVTTPITLAEGTSLVSTVSYLLTDSDCPNRTSTTPGHTWYHTPRPCLRTAAVLTCVGSALTTPYFRPPYASEEKPLIPLAAMDTSILPNLTPAPNPPSMDSVLRSVQRVWLDHMTGEVADYHRPRMNQPNYGRDLSDRYNIAAMVSMVNIDSAHKELLATRLIQIGIDHFHIVKAGGGWGYNSGAIGLGHKLPIIYAARLLDHPEMKRIGHDYGPEYFQEDSQVFHISQAETALFTPTTRTNCTILQGSPTTIVDADGGNWWINDRGQTQPLLSGRGFPTNWSVRIHYPNGENVHVRARGMGGDDAEIAVFQPCPPGTGLTVEVELYPQYRIGYPDWAERYLKKPAYAYYSQNYRWHVGKVLGSSVLAALMLGAKDIWNHDATFDFADIYRDEFANTIYLYNSTQWTLAMWDTYRSAYGPIWSSPDMTSFLRLAPIGTQAVTVGQTLTLSIRATSSESGDVSYSATDLPSGATFTGQTFTWTPTATQVGTHQVTFQATDGDLSDLQIVTIVVQRPDQDPNSDPILAAIGDKSVHENATLTFSISASDPDGDPITYSATGLPAGADFSGQTFSWTPAYGQAGSYQVTFIASDGWSRDTETITITVIKVNRAPILSEIGDRSIDQDRSLTFDVTAIDPDGDAVAYSASGLPSGASFENGTFDWTPSASQIGAHDVAFAASDGDLQDTETVTIFVAPARPDDTAPTVARCAPEPGAVQVSLNHLVMLHVTDEGSGVDPESIVIRVGDGIVYQGDRDVYESARGRCSRIGTYNDYQFVYQANEPFGYDHTIRVEVDAADRTGNVMPTHAYSFTTERRAFGSHRAVSAGFGVPGPKGRPATINDSVGTIWVVWCSGPENDRDIYISRMPAGSDGFEAPVSITTAPGDRCHPTVTRDNDGALYVAWQERQRGNWDIFVAVSSDGIVWSRPIQVTDSDANETHPAIAADTQSPSHVYIAWQDDRDGHSDIFLARSVSAFSDSVVSRLTTDATDQIAPDVAIDAHDVAYVVWTDKRRGRADLYGASSEPKGWANIPIVTADSQQTNPAIAIDKDSSVLHLLWVDDAPGDTDIYYAAIAGLPDNPISSGVSIIDDTSGADQFAPAIFSPGGSTVFACWQDRRHTGQHPADADLFFAELGPRSVGTNVFIGAERTESDRAEPMIGVDGYGNPYLVWTDARSTEPEVYFAATTFVDPHPLDAKHVVASIGATVGTDPAAIGEADDVSIVIPAAACPTDMRISVSKILNPPVAPVDCLGSYDFGPSGVRFTIPVTITVPYRVTGANSSAKPYWYDSLTGALTQQGVTDVENLIIAPNLNALRFKTMHFTPFYVVADTPPRVLTDGPSGGACSISTTGGGSPKDVLGPYIVVAIAIVVLRCGNGRRRHSLKTIQEQP